MAVALLPHLEAIAKERERIRKSSAPSTDEATTEKSPESGESRENAAKIVGTNSNYVSLAKKLAAGDPERFEKVRTGEVKVQNAVWAMEGEQRNQRWEERQKETDKKRKAALAARPDPEEANRLALDKGEMIEASDGQWYDGQTDEEREEKAQARKALWAQESDCRDVIWAVEAITGIETDPELLVPEFTDEDLAKLSKGLVPTIELLEKLRPALQRQAKEEND